jgi:hypothetical protein
MIRSIASRREDGESETPGQAAGRAYNGESKARRMPSLPDRPFNWQDDGEA